MKTLFKNANIVNVFTDEIFKSNLLIEDEVILGFGDYYSDSDADKIIDVNNKYICPCLIDAHMHIESSKITPYYLSEELARHGTCAIVADPHEIANVCGIEGIKYLINSSNDMDVDMYFMVPSCVPASPFDESATVLDCEKTKKIYEFPRILGLAEMMNYPGVINNDKDVISKIEYADEQGLIINGHAPLLSGKDLDKYISCHIYDDHESSTFKEAYEKIQKGQVVFIREGSSAKDLSGLLKLFDNRYNKRCLLCTDDISAHDVYEHGHIDNIIRRAAEFGVDPVIAIRMASIQAAQFYNLEYLGAIAPGYKASFIVLSDLGHFNIEEVYIKGKLIDKNSSGNNSTQDSNLLQPSDNITKSVVSKKLTPQDLIIDYHGKHKTKIIQCFPHSLITETICDVLDYDCDNGICVAKDIIKIAVCERHGNSGNIGLGFITGLKIENGAIASSVAHDSHNIVIAGTNEEDLCIAHKAIVEQNGGYVVVEDGQVISRLQLEIAGLMSNCSAKNLTDNLNDIIAALKKIAPEADFNLFDTLQFMSLTVMPSLKISTKGLVDVDNFCLTDLFV